MNYFFKLYLNVSLRIETFNSFIFVFPPIIVSTKIKVTTSDNKKNKFAFWNFIILMVMLDYTSLFFVFKINPFSEKPFILIGPDIDPSL